MTAVLRFKFLEICNSFQHIPYINKEIFKKQNGSGFPAKQNEYRSLFKSHGFRSTFTTINFARMPWRLDWPNAEESVTDSGKVIDQWSLLANNTAPITPPNQSREPIKRVKLMSSRVLSDAVMEPERFPFRKSFSVYKTETAIVKHWNRKTLTIIHLNSVIFFKRSCIW